MGKLVEHLMPCAICGAVPKINDVYDIDPEKAEHCYKLFCSENGVHNSTGEWFANKYKACQDWNRRQQALGETIETLGNRLKPCPFCGRKMQFHNDVLIDRDGKRRNYLYFLHEDYDINKEESCILDDICMQAMHALNQAVSANMQQDGTNVLTMKIQCMKSNRRCLERFSRWNEPWNCSNSETRNWKKKTRS